MESTPIIMTSEIVIGDSSTVLWLAGLMGVPMVYSIRVFKNLISPQLAGLSKDIIYCSSVKDFSSQLDIGSKKR